ncbi:APC family permease [Patescibacteria group bacterium]|nr:APC family permease [Patescibacteria group bacterium]
MPNDSTAQRRQIKKRKRLTPQLSISETQKLGQWSATAICGNDITSSALYVAAIATFYAGYLAPVVLLIVAGVLYLYRNVYNEVVTALPLNGGAYNALLNTTSKFKASIAACLTILSYLATAVISARISMAYIESLFPQWPAPHATVGLLAVFAVLTMIGISESSRVALVIFILHMLTLTLLSITALINMLADTSFLTANWGYLPPNTSLISALFFGFSAALLGISGFESSSNFVEEQKVGVFPKTLRNMWIAVSIFNPLIALLVLGNFDNIHIPEHQRDYLLAILAQRVFSGNWLKVLVSVDAAVVLSGAVLTSYVGVTGLIRRMALDRCLPQFLLRTNRRGTSHWIIICFFTLCVSIIAVTGGELLSLAGVYTISFLSVMTLFATGNILLKVRRARLQRDFIASWPTVLVAFAAATIGIIGNIIMKPNNFFFFLYYFVPTLLLVTIMLERDLLLRVLLFALNQIAGRFSRWNRRMSKSIQGKIDEINSQAIIFFTRGDGAANLNRAMLYVRNNETTNRVLLVHVYEDKKKIPDRLRQDIAFLNEVYPEIKMELVLRPGTFSPEMVDQLSQELNVPKNYMFIGHPGQKFPHNIADLGGVRLII